MVRPRKQTVNYFPHRCTHRKSMFIIEQRWGNDGYAFWFKLLEMLGSAEGHYLRFESTADWEFLMAKTNLSEYKCKKILNLLSILNCIDGKLWDNYRVVWSDKFVDGIKDAYRNRVQEIPHKPNFLRKKLNLGKQSYVRNPHIILKKTKVKEKKVETPSSKPKKVFDINSVEYRCSKYLFKKIKENNPEAKEPNLQIWARHIDLMLRIDKRGIRNIKKVIDWCQADDFWHINILSTQKLRERYDQLVVKMKSEIKVKKEEDYIQQARRCYKEQNYGACMGNADLNSKRCKWCYDNLKK